MNLEQRKRYVRLKRYVLSLCICPCCEEEEKCLDECTFAEDCPEEYQEIASAREAYFLTRKGRKHPEETEYQKAIRTGFKPEIWPPVVMTRDDLQHFRATHGIEEIDNK